MDETTKEILSEMIKGRISLAALHPETMQAWRSYTQAALKPGALDSKTKELIALAIGLAVHCSYCIVYHTYTALKAGATRRELTELAFINVMMGGGPSMTYAQTLFLESVNTFAPELGK
jgi:AhpD family alkylhydroperoxidase